MGLPKLLTLALAAAACGIAGVQPSFAQCRLCDTPVTRVEPASRTTQVTLEIETSIDFGRLVLASAGEGSALLRSDGSSAAGGSLAELSTRAMVGSAVVRGEPGRAVRIELPRRIVLHSLGGGEITFEEVESDLPAMPRLDAAGNLAFRFGGRLRVSGDSEGVYHGDLPITVEYL
jgi:hypothetical protein